MTCELTALTDELGRRCCHCGKGRRCQLWGRLGWGPRGLQRDLSVLGTSSSVQKRQETIDYSWSGGGVQQRMSCYLYPRVLTNVLQCEHIFYCLKKTEYSENCWPLLLPLGDTQLTPLRVWLW